MITMISLPNPTFAEYAAEQDARNTIELNVRKWCLMLIDALKDNYRDYAIRGHERSILNAAAPEQNPDSATYQYHLNKMVELKNGDCDIDYEIVTGKKYHKIVFIDGGGQRSVHCFVDRKTGEVYKSASWKSPAKGVRYDLRLITDREYLFENADWSGGYLYQK